DSLGANESGDNEESRGQPELAQNRRCHLAVIGVSVIESNGERAPHVLAGVAACDLLRQGNDIELGSEELAELLESSRSESQVTFRKSVVNAMKRDDNHLRAEIPSKDSGFASCASNDVLDLLCEWSPDFCLHPGLRPFNVHRRYESFGW